MRKVKPGSNHSIAIGYRGEYNATEVVIGITDYSGMTVTVMHQRCGDDEPYAVSDATVDSTKDAVVWIPSIVDTANAGAGKLQIQFYKSGTLIKTDVYNTFVQTSLGEPSETPPEAYQSWVDSITQKSAEAVAAKDAAVTAQAAAEDAKDEAEEAADSVAIAAWWPNMVPWPPYSSEGVKTGVTFTILDDGGIHCEGFVTPSESGTDNVANFFFSNDLLSGARPLPAGDYIVGGGISKDFDVVVSNVDDGETHEWVHTYKFATSKSGTSKFTSEEGELWCVRIRIREAAGEVNETIYPIISRGSVVQEYSHPKYSQSNLLVSIEDNADDIATKADQSSVYTKTESNAKYQAILTTADKQAIADMHSDAVKSVNSKTGTVVLSASDIEDTNGNTIQEDINTLNADLADEQTARKNADDALQTAVDGKQDKPSDWVLKGTWTDPSSPVELDLTGCTEMCLYGYGTADTFSQTTATNLYINKKTSTACRLIQATFASGSTRTLFAEWEDDFLGIKNTACEYIAAYDSVSTGFFLQGFSIHNGMKISDIESIGFLTPSAMEEVNIKVYAR